MTYMHSCLLSTCMYMERPVTAGAHMHVHAVANLRGACTWLGNKVASQACTAFCNLEADRDASPASAVVPHDRHPCTTSLCSVSLCSHSSDCLAVYPVHLSSCHMRLPPQKAPALQALAYLLQALTHPPDLVSVATSQGLLRQNCTRAALPLSFSLPPASAQRAPQPLRPTGGPYPHWHLNTAVDMRPAPATATKPSTGLQRGLELREAAPAAACGSRAA